MPSFDNIARAAVTPGGFQAGVNDIIQAIMQNKTAQAKMAGMQEQQGWERDFKERSLGADISNQLASRRLQERGVATGELNAKTNAALAGNTVANTWADNAGSVGKYMMDKLVPDARGPGVNADKRDVAGERFDYDKNKDRMEQARREANIEVYGNDKGEAYDVQEENLTTFGIPMIDPKTGAAVKSGNKKYIKRPSSPEEAKRAEAAYRTRMQALGSSSGLGSGITDARTQPPVGKTDGESMNEKLPAPRPGVDITTPSQMTAPGARGGMGSQVAGALGAAPAQPAIDYAAEDARLQLTNPKYKQLRSSPGFDWKAAITKYKAEGR